MSQPIIDRNVTRVSEEVFNRSRTALEYCEQVRSQLQSRLNGRSKYYLIFCIVLYVIWTLIVGFVVIYHWNDVYDTSWKIFHNLCTLLMLIALNSFVIFRFSLEIRHNRRLYEYYNEIETISRSIQQTESYIRSGTVSFSLERNTAVPLSNNRLGRAREILRDAETIDGYESSQLDSIYRWLYTLASFCFSIFLCNLLGVWMEGVFQGILERWGIPNAFARFHAFLSAISYFTEYGLSLFVFNEKEWDIPLRRQLLFLMVIVCYFFLGLISVLCHNNHPFRQ